MRSCEETVDIPQLQLVEFFGQVRCHPCRGAVADFFGPVNRGDFQLQYIDKVIDVPVVRSSKFECSL